MIKIPDVSCPRARDDCIALSTIIACDESSFFCCGENNGDSRPVDQDKYTTCFKGAGRDDIHYYDKRDLIHHASVMLQAVAVVEKDIASEKKDWSAWDLNGLPPPPKPAGPANEILNPRGKIADFLHRCFA